jgi:SAM-dependent methyltransferase
MSRYGTLSSEFYDLDKPEPLPDAFDFYAELARRARGPIHEPMCGSGRYFLPLLAEGLEISGSDSSPEMLARCRHRAAERGLTPWLSQQTLQSLACSPAPALIFIPSGSFGLLLDDALVTRALQQVYDVLSPGGTFAVEAELLQPAAPETSGVWGGRWLERADGAKLVLSWLTQYSGAANITTSLHRYELLKDGQVLAVEYDDFRVRSYTCAEFRALLGGAGFRDIEALRPYESTPTGDADDAAVFLCRKH